jgi:soluble lytic murein transglycosylase
MLTLGALHEMKLSTLLLLVVAGSVATWVACSSGVPSIPPPFGPAPTAVEGARGSGSELEEGLLDLSALDTPRPPLPSAAQREAGMAQLSRGLELSAARDAAGAAREFAGAAESLPPLADWAEVLAARAYAAVGDVTEVHRRVERVEGTGAGEWAWRALYDALLAAGDTSGAVAVADRHAAAAQTAAERALAWARSGDLRAARRDMSGAQAAYRRAMRASRNSPGGLAAARGALGLPGLPPEDRLLVGRTLLAHGGLDRGVPMLETYASDPAVPLAARAEVRLEVGRALFNARRYEPAERNLRAAATREAEAAFLLARTLYRQGRQEQGVQGFLAVARDHANTPAAADALFLLGDLAHDAGRIAAAAEHYRQAIATGVHNAAAADAAVRLAGMSLLAANAPAALRDLNGYLAQRPRDRLSAPAVYWLGRAQLALGDQAEAEERFREVLRLDPFSYYGMLAAERVGASLRTVRLPEPPALDPRAAEAIEYAFFRLDVLRDAGLTDEAELELGRLQESMAENHAALYYVAEAMSRHGQPIAGALLGRRIQQARGVWDDRLLRIVFQFPYRELVVRESRRQGLDPYAVAGLIRQESFFNPVAVSPAGAVGLMQVMPQTAAGLARRGGITNYQAGLLRNPDTNVRLGTLFLADQMNRWGGRLSDVYGAYNAGPTRVARWRQFAEHRDDEIYVERIPIAETRDYVKRVRLNGEIYRRLYAD